MGLLFGLSYALFSSMGKTVLKLGLTTFKPSISFFWETVFGLLIWVPAALSYGINIQEAINIIPVVLIGAVLSEAYIFYIYSKGDLSIIGTVFPTYSIFTIFFSYILLGERLSIPKAIAVTITITGVFFIALPTKRTEWRKNLAAVLWALSGAFAIGFADSLGKDAINNTSSFTLLFTLAFMQIPVALVFLKLEKQNISEVAKAIKYYQRYRLPLLSAFLIGLAQLFFWLSFEGVNASIASPITSTNAMITAIFAIKFLKEPANFSKIIGILFVSVGILGIALN